MITRKKKKDFISVSLLLFLVLLLQLLVHAVSAVDNAFCRLGLCAPLSPQVAYLYTPVRKV